MTENESRRGARRQQRGLQRQAEILQAAALVFDEVGYGDATTNAIAAKAGISPGSLYQFFPNKEAIANALAQHYTQQLHALWDNSFTPELIALPLDRLVDVLVDSMLTFDKERPGFSTLFFGEDTSPQLAAMGHELHDGIIERFARLVGARNPKLPPKQQTLVANVMMRLYKAFIPIMVDSGNGDDQQVITEMKIVLRGYLAYHFEDR
jgi:AcrR family transcriptional regulator